MSKLQSLQFSILLFALICVSSCLSASVGLNVVKDQFDANGYIKLPNLFSEDKLEEWKQFSKEYFEAIFVKLYENGHIKFPSHSRRYGDGRIEYAMTKAHGFQEIVMRSFGRYELSMTRGSSATAHGIPTIHPLLEKLSIIIPSLLSVESMNNVTIDYSMLVTTPGAVEQKWHTDGFHSDMNRHMPCHALNVFIPLVDVTPELGPTEMYPRSHFHTRMPPPIRVAGNLVPPPVAPLLNVGDAIIWDYRLLHRGKPNLSNSKRPILVLTFSQDWFYDTENWPNRSLSQPAVTEEVYI